MYKTVYFYKERKGKLPENEHLIYNNADNNTELLLLIVRNNINYK